MVLRTFSRLTKHIDSCVFFETHKHLKIGILGISETCCSNKLIKVLNSAYANHWLPFNTIIPKQDIRQNIKEQIINHSITEPHVLAIVPKEYISIKNEIFSDTPIIIVTIDPNEKSNDYDYLLE